MLAKTGLTVGGGARHAGRRGAGAGRGRRMGAEEALVREGVVPAVAPGVAAKDAPPGQDDATQYAELGNGLNRIVRATRLVLAPRRDQRREERAVQRDREDRHAAAEG